VDEKDELSGNEQVCFPDSLHSMTLDKGKVESGVGHAQRTPLKGLRFESLEEAQAYLDHWEQRWADTRIHGTTKRQVAATFAEEKPTLLPLPLGLASRTPEGGVRAPKDLLSLLEHQEVAPRRSRDGEGARPDL
jgi:hypothetical protein